MILVRLMGGLGNQMFQYAFGKSMAIRLDVELKLDLSLLGIHPNVKDQVVRQYDLDIFDLKDRVATEKEVAGFNGATDPSFADRVKYKMGKLMGSYPLVIQNDHVFDEEQIASVRNEACLVGRWQSESYWKDNRAALKKIFTLSKFPPSAVSLEVIKKTEGYIRIFVHVRRGDYVTHPVYSKTLGSLDVDYYFNAIDYMSRSISGELRFIFVSDDITWCRKHFSSVRHTFFVDQEAGKSGYASDLWMMTQCQHAIISNSTFSWWGAWMAEGKDSLIIAPETWARDIRFCPPRIIPERWKKMTNKFCVENLSC